jgi:DNA primase
MTALLGPAIGRRGEGGRRLWWKCPFHEDRNPSLTVKPGGRWWKCYGCGQEGDAIALVIRLEKVDFPRAVRIVLELAGIIVPFGQSAPPPLPMGKAATTPSKPPEQSSGLPLVDALRLMIEASERLWTPQGTEALGYLRGRGLRDETIRVARLGWTPGTMIPTAAGDRAWSVNGITIPWLEGDRLTLVKIRRPAGKEPKYAEAFRDRPGVYPSLEVARPGLPLIVCEGEFDALLLGQELRRAPGLPGWAAVVTLGSASAKPDYSLLAAAVVASSCFVAFDSDVAGQKAAAAWPAGFRRVRLPEGAKDWTELHQQAPNGIRYVWGRYLPMSLPWEELAVLRWGSPEERRLEGE